MSMEAQTKVDSNLAKVLINGVEKEIPFAMLSREDLLANALGGLVNDPNDYVIRYRVDGKDYVMVQGERLNPAQGMQITVTKRVLG